MSKQRVTLQSVIQSRQGRGIFSGEQKAKTRDAINHHIQQTSFSTQQTSHTSSFVTRKRLVSGAVLASIFGALYGIWGLPQDSVIFDNPVFTLLRPDHTTSIPRVLASSVGQVVSADGNYSIVNDDVTYSTNMIYDGDTIELAADSRLSFMVDGHQAYIVGPASVHISIDGDGYRFTMIDGEFLEVFSSRNPAGSSLTVQMRDIILAHNAHDTTMKVQLSADASGDTIVKNYADSVVVARVDDVTDMKDLAPETQLTIAPSTSLASATEAKFSLTDIAFVSDSSSVVNEGEASLLSFIDLDDTDATITSSSTSDVMLMAFDQELGGDVGGSDVLTAATLATGVLSGPTVDVLVSDRLLPTGQQLAVLRQLLTTDIDTISRVWDSVALSYDCERLSADVDIISSCVSGIIDSYHIPPSLLDSLHVWLSDMTQKSVSENTTDTQVEGADVVDDSDITISQ